MSTISGIILFTLVLPIHALFVTLPQYPEELPKDHLSDDGVFSASLSVGNDRTEVSEDVAVKIPVLRNDFDLESGLDSSSLSIIQESLTGMGSTYVDRDLGMIVYRPQEDFFGRDSFEYRVCNNNGICDVANVTITVHPMNDPPFAQNDTINLSEDEMVLINPMLNDIDRDAHLEMRLEIKSQPNFGTAMITGNKLVSYAPDDHFFGKDFFYYRICDDLGFCDSAMVQLLIAPINDMPQINPDFDTTFQNILTVIDPLKNDYDTLDQIDLDRSSLTVSASSAMAGSIYLDTILAMLIYQPPQDFTGVDTFNYQICDQGPGDIICGKAQVLVTVLPDPGLKKATGIDRQLLQGSLKHEGMSELELNLEDLMQSPRHKVTRDKLNPPPE